MLFYIIVIYIYKTVRPLTHLLTQHCPGDSMEDWVTDFGVQIGFEALTSTKTGFCEIQPPSPQGGGEVKNHIFKHNSAPKYLTMTKLHSRWLDMNIKNSFSAILEFSFLRVVMGENTDFSGVCVKKKSSIIIRLQIISR